MHREGVGKTNVSKNRSTSENLASMIFDSYILETKYLYCTVIVEVKIKHELLSNHLFQRQRGRGGLEESQDNYTLL